MTLKLSRAEATRLGIGPKPKAKSEKTSGKPAKGRHKVSVEAYEREPLRFLVPLKPQSKHRPRTYVDENSVRKGLREARGNFDIFMKHLRMRTVTTTETREFERAVAQAASLAMRGGSPIEGPVKVSAVFMFSGRDDVWPVGQADGDLDNLEKSFSDALNGIAFSDDRMIVAKETWKICVDGPDGIWITVSPARNDLLIEALDSLAAGG